MDKNIGVAVDQVYTKVREWEGEDMKEMKREERRACGACLVSSEL